MWTRHASQLMRETSGLVISGTHYPFVAVTSVGPTHTLLALLHQPIALSEIWGFLFLPQKGQHFPLFFLGKLPVLGFGSAAPRIGLQWIFPVQFQQCNWLGPELVCNGFGEILHNAVCHREDGV